MPRPKQNASLEQLTPYFHLPIKTASLKLGVCTTVLKRICRDHGISRWPYRQIKSLDKKICNKIACLLVPTPNETNKTVQQIVELYKFSKDTSTDESIDSNMEPRNLETRDTVTSLPTTNLEKQFKNQALAHQRHQHILKLSPVTAVINTIAPVIHNTSNYHHHHHHHHHHHNTSLRPTQNTNNNNDTPMVTIPTHINTNTHSPILNTNNVNISTCHRYNNSSNELRSAFKPTSQKHIKTHQSALSKMNIDFLVQSTNNAYVNTVVAMNGVY